MSDSGMDWSSVFTLAFSLGMVLILAWATARFAVPAFYARARREQGPLRLRATLPLGPKTTVYLIEAGSRVLCVGVTESQLTVLATLEPDEVPAAMTVVPRRSA